MSYHITGLYETGDEPEIKPCDAGDIKKGMNMLIKGYPCKVLSVSKCKTGKHGSAKCSITGLCWITGKKCEDSMPSSANVEIPETKKNEYELINILEDDYLTLMHPDSGETFEEIKLLDHKNWNEMNEKIKEDFEEGHELMLTVLDVMDVRLVIAHRKISS